MSELAVETCDSAPDALGRIAGEDYDAIVTDIKMPGMDGLALLDEIQKLRPETPTLLITGHGEHDLAVQALRRGAYDYIQKPIDRDYFTASLGRAIEKRGLARRIELQRLELERHSHVLEHVGDGVFVVDRDGVVQFWNLAAEQITGIGLEQAVGRPARRAARRLGGGRTLDPRRRRGPAEAPARADAAVRRRRPRGLALALRRRRRGRDRLLVPGPHRRARRRQAQGRLRRHGLARAADAALGHLRRRQDAASGRRPRRGRRRAA